jgi:hypothetical protein
MSVDDYIAKNPLIIQNSPKIKETTIDGEKLVWLEGQRLLSFHNGSIFEISIYNVDDTTINNFIKTFKFMDDLTANWQTYKNEQYGFEVKYPNSVDINVEEGVAVDAIPTKLEDQSKKLLSIGIKEPGHGGYRFDSGSSEQVFVEGISLTKLIDWDPILPTDNPNMLNKNIVLQRVNIISNKIVGMSLYFSCTDKKEDCIYLFNQILSTFKFTK